MMLDKREHFDQQDPWIRRVTRNSRFRLLWYAIVAALAAFQVLMLVRPRRQDQVFLHSKREMVLVVALVIVCLLGVVVKSRQNRQARS
jgi:phosphate starvation-inducible membrane PsiE